MRLSKNPNQCPPRCFKSIIPRQKREKQSDQVYNSHENMTSSGSSFNSQDKPKLNVTDPLDLETVTNNRIIHVTVKNESRSTRSGSVLSDPKRVLYQIIADQPCHPEHPDFNTLKPVQLISSESFTEGVMQLQNRAISPKESSQAKSPDLKDVLSDNPVNISKLTTQPKIYQTQSYYNHNGVSIINSRLRPKSQLSMRNA